MLAPRKLVAVDIEVCQFDFFEIHNSPGWRLKRGLTHVNVVFATDEEARELTVLIKDVRKLIERIRPLRGFP